MARCYYNQLFVYIYGQGAELEMSLAGKVALVAGATRGAGRGIAVELGAAGATVYVTGRTTRERRSEYDRPETIEETAELVTARRRRRASRCRPTISFPSRCARWSTASGTEHGRLDVLVNDIWGGERLVEWDKPVWEHDLATACACCTWRSTPTSSPRTTRFRC